MAVTTSSFPVTLCQGYDKVMCAGRNIAVRGEMERWGGMSSVKFQVCLGIHEMIEAMEIEYPFMSDFLCIGICEKQKFINALGLTRHSVCIFVYAKHTEATETVINVSLRSGIQKPMTNRELEEFFQVYGDSYLSSRRKGGEYLAVYAYYPETREQQSELTEKMKAEGILSLASVDASLGTNIKRLNSSLKIRMAFKQTISGITNPKLPSLDQMIEFALKFPSLPLTNPVIIYFATTGYEYVPGIGNIFGPIVHNRDLIYIGYNLRAKLSGLQELRNDLSDLKSIHNFYGGFEDKKLDEVQMQLKADVEAIKEMLRKYEANPTKSVVIPVLRSMENGIPSLQYVGVQSTLYGGGGGKQFDDVGDIQAFLQQKRRIKAFQLRTGSVVDLFRVSYSSGEFLCHGGKGGTATRVVEVPWGKFVTSISGSFGMDTRYSEKPLVTKLKIEVGDDQSVSAGINSSNSFEWHVPKNCFVLGFRGCSDSYLKNLQIVYASFKPTLWRTS